MWDSNSWSSVSGCRTHFQQLIDQPIKQENLYDYADDNSVSVNNKALNIGSRLLQLEAEVTVRWFCSNAMEANPIKFRGIVFNGNKPVSDFKVFFGGQDI